MNRIITLFLCTFLFVIGCGGHKSSSKVTTTKAWNAFESSDYEGALEFFIELIPTQGSPALVGAGWCSIRLGKLEDALQYFNKASSTDPDALAGLSFVEWGLGDVSEALAKANATLQLKGDYAFSRDNRVDHKDIIWIQAASYFQLHDRANCLAKIKLLNASFNTDINAAGADQVLLAEIQSLGAAHS